MKDATEVFKAIGDSTRFRSLRILVLAGRELCACEIIDATEKPQYAISKALGILVDAGLLSERREGRMMMYTLAHNPMNDALFQALASVPKTKELIADDERLKARLGRRRTNVCVNC